MRRPLHLNLVKLTTILQGVPLAPLLLKQLGCGFLGQQSSLVEGGFAPENNGVGIVVVLDVDLIVSFGGSGAVTALAGHVVLDHAHEAQELLAFDLLRVKVVSFGHVKMRDHIFGALRKEEAAVDVDLVEVELVVVLLEIVDD